MRAQSKIIISLNDNDRKVLNQVKDMLEDTVKILQETDGEVDIDDMNDYGLIRDVYEALNEIYDAL